MPEWLLQKDNYIPLKDKDAFINKSILSILNILTRFMRQTEYKANKLEFNALLKLISALIFITFVSLTKSFTFVLIANVFMLVIINFLDINEIKYILKISSSVAIFTFIILLPSVFFRLW